MAIVFCTPALADVPGRKLSVVTQALGNNGSHQIHDSAQFGCLVIHNVYNGLIVTPKSHRGLTKFTGPDENRHHDLEKLQECEVSGNAYLLPRLRPLGHAPAASEVKSEIQAACCI